MPNPCFVAIPPIPDPDCIESGNETISEIWIRQANLPIPLLTKSSSGETAASQLARSLAAVLALSDDTQVYVMPVFKGEMPKVSPALKTNPQDGTVFNDIATPLKFNWTDWRNNDEVWIQYAQLTGSAYYTATNTFVPGSTPVKCLMWAKASGKLYGGLSGFQGTFTAEPSLVQGTEVASRIEGTFNTIIQGSIPLRITLP